MGSTKVALGLGVMMGLLSSGRLRMPNGLAGFGVFSAVRSAHRIVVTSRKSSHQRCLSILQSNHRSVRRRGSITEEITHSRVYPGVRPADLESLTFASARRHNIGFEIWRIAVRRVPSDRKCKHLIRTPGARKEGSSRTGTFRTRDYIKGALSNQSFLAIAMLRRGPF